MTQPVFLPGSPLPDSSATANERRLYYAFRWDGEAATMTVETGTWQWRRLRGGEGPDAYGSGGWGALQEWPKG